MLLLMVILNKRYPMFIFFVPEKEPTLDEKSLYFLLD